MLASVNNQLTSAKAGLTVLQSRLTSENVNLNADPGDPDLQTLDQLRIETGLIADRIGGRQDSLGANNPKMVTAQASMVALRKQIADATGKMHQHLQERIALQETRSRSWRRLRPRRKNR